MTDTKISALLYGRAKSGKSTLADSSPGPRLIIDAEMGTDFLTSDQHEWDIEAGEAVPALEEDDTCVIHVHDYTTLGKIYEFLDIGNHPFETVIIDSITEIQQRCIDDKVGTAQLKIQDWGDIKRKLSLDIRKFRDLKVNPVKSVNVFFIATLEEINAPDGTVRYVPHMQGSIAKELPYVVDIVGMLYLSNEDNKTRKLRVGSHPLFDTGDRTGYLPEVIESPDVYEILDMIEEASVKAKAERKEKRALRLKQNKEKVEK
jgi:hypothetical protein